MIKIFKNPFYVYIYSFTVVLVLYVCNGSYMYPNLTTPLLIFFLFTFLAMFFLGLYIENKTYIEYRPIKKDRTKLLLLMICLIFSLYFIEIIINKGFPLLSIIEKNTHTHYKTFGIKYIHLITVTLNTFYIIYSFHYFLSKKTIIRFILYSIAYVPSIIIMSRGLMIIGLLASFFVLVLSLKQIGKKTTISLLILSCLSMYFFGVLGDIRSFPSERGETIYKNGKANKLFSKTIPKEFFWTYLYSTSPLANFQHTINNVENNIEEVSFDYFSLFINECIPKVFSKRVNEIIKTQKIEGYRITPWLTASTVYSKSFCYSKWFGPIFIFIYTVFFIFFILKMTKKESESHVTTIAILLTLIFLNIFTNMFSFSGVSLLFVYSFLIIFFERFTTHLK